MARIGILVDRWDPDRGGAEQALAHFAEHLAARGHDPCAVVLRGVDHGLPLVRAEAPGGLWRASALREAARGAWTRAVGERLWEAARRAGCELTVGVRHLPRCDVYWPHGGSHAATWEALRRARGAAAGRPRGRHRTFVELERALVAGGGARRVLCVSELVRQELEAFYPEARERLFTVANGVDLERFHPRERASAGRRLRRELGVEDEALLVFAARNPSLKGLASLLTALGALGDRPWKLLVAGLRDAEPWRRRARALGIELRRFLWRPYEDALGLAAAADLCVLPTWRDTSGLVLLEALACGTPVVTTRFAGAADVLGPQAGTVLEDPGDVEALTAALRGWLERAEPVDRDAVRRCVEGRGRAEWLAELERHVEEVLAEGTREPAQARRGAGGARAGA